MSNYKLTITLTPDQLVTGLQAKFRQVVRDLHEEFKFTLNSPVFYWDSTTHRKNGEVVGNIRNAIDTGELLESQGYKFISPRLAAIEWEAPYTEEIFSHASQDLVDFTLARMKT